MTKIVFNKDDGEIILPASFADTVDRARKFDIKVLIALARLGDKATDTCYSVIAKELDCDISEIKASVAFWNGTGVITVCEGEETVSPVKKKQKEAEAPKKKIKAHELPQYTSDELNDLLEKYAGVGSFLEECQNVLGKIFNTHDVATLMGIIDYLGVNEEYILVLMHHFADKGIKSMRYIEKTAVSCVDEGIVDADVLEETLHAREEAKQAHAQIKIMFGLNSRSFTAKEKTLIDTWLNTYKFDMDIIRRAYEITVDTINKPSIPYAGKILDKWYLEELKTLPEIEEYLNAYKKEKGESSSFDLDEFFNAAVKRSYDDK